MNNDPRYSIVIPAYNGSDSITQTLNSCFKQSVKELEVVVVDDGSSDNTLEVLGQITDPRLVVVSQKNAGPAAARNHGMRVAKGRYIAFLDADDVWYPDFLAEAEKIYAQTPDKVIYSQIIVDRGVDRYWIKPDRAMGASESIYDYLYIKGAFIQTSTMVIPASLADKVSWDETVTFGDNDQFAIDCWQSGTGFVMLEQPKTLYADIMSPTALSQLPIFSGNSEKYTNFFDWMETQKPHMSEAAWAGFQARFKSVAMARKAPLASFKLLLNARKHNAISTLGILRQVVQNYAPRFYRRLVDQYVRLRGLPLSALEK